MFDIDKVIMPCDLCGKEPAHWIGDDAGTKGMFICDLCGEFSPDELFNIALTLAEEDKNRGS